MVGARNAQKNRVEKLLEEACLKLSVVASDIHGVSGRAMMEAMIAGERDPRVLAGLARTRMRTKLTLLQEAFAGLKVGTFDEQHRFRLALMLARIDRDDADIAALDARIEALLAPSRTPSPASMRSPELERPPPRSSSPRSVWT